jgi:hypothetical protein
LVPGTDRLVFSDAAPWPASLIVDVETLRSVVVDADVVPSDAGLVAATADGTWVAFAVREDQRSWLLAVDSGDVTELSGRVIGFVRGGPVVLHLEEDTATYSVPVDGGVQVVTTGALAEVEMLADGSVVVVEPDGTVRLVSADGTERDVGHVTISREPYTEYDGYVDLYVANFGTRFLVETEAEVHLFDTTGRSLAMFEIDRFGVLVHEQGTAEPRCVSVGGGLLLDTETGAAFEPLHDPWEHSSDGCVFATASSRTPAFYVGNKRIELERGTDIVGISPDGSTGIAYRDGWYWMFDLGSPDSSFRQILASSEPNRTFGFVRIDASTTWQ